jgi:hypothetical protein
MSGTRALAGLLGCLVCEPVVKKRLVDVGSRLPSRCPILTSSWISALPLNLVFKLVASVPLGEDAVGLPEVGFVAAA